MKKNLISKINGVEIYAVMNGDEVYVPVRPVCQAIGLSYSTQLEKLKEDPTFSASTVPLGGTVAADGKEREMMCLPLWLVYLWLGTINPRNVNEESRQRVADYRLECAHALYEHFSGKMARTIEENEAEIALLKEENEILTAEKELKARHKKVKESLQKLRAERLNPQPRLL